MKKISIFLHILTLLGLLYFCGSHFFNSTRIAPTEYNRKYEVLAYFILFLQLMTTFIKRTNDYFNK